MCYQIYCSSLSLTIKVNNDFIVCPRTGGNIKVDGYDGYLHCPDYNLMCSGTVLCNDIFDCISKKSIVKESSYIYDYIPVTTQKYSKIGQMNISSVAYELSEDGFCPKYCSQCYSNKTCKICQEGHDCIEKSNTGNKNKTLWIVLPIVIAIVVVGIIITVVFIYKKRKRAETNFETNKAEMTSDLGIN